MSRKRLGRVDLAKAHGVREAAEHAARAGRPGTAPIAQIAAGVGREIDAEIHRLRVELSTAAKAASALETAEAEGRVLKTIALGEIDLAYQIRDRFAIARSGEDWAALRASIEARGQQMPIEVADQGEGVSPRYGLISGMRRVLVLQELYEDTGEERFARVTAMLRPAHLAGTDRLVAMIEENEIRSDISFYERGRIAALAAREGVFADADAAVDGLFASSHRNRRYKIRCFVTVHEALDGVLWFPQAIGERQGIALAKAIRAGRGGEIRAALEGAGGRDMAGETRLLASILAMLEAPARAAKPETLEAAWDGPRGRRVVVRTVPGTGRITLDLEGQDEMDEGFLQRLADWLGGEIAR